MARAEQEMAQSSAGIFTTEQFILFLEKRYNVSFVSLVVLIIFEIFKVSVLIVKNLSKGRPSITRLPKAFINLVILEETAFLGKTYKSGDLPKSPLCLVRNVAPKKLLNILRPTQEILLSNEDFLSILNYSSRQFTVDNLPLIEDEIGFALNFFAKIENSRERRSIYSRVFRSESENESLNLLVSSRAAFCDDVDLEITGLVFRDISQKKLAICESCDETFTRSDNLTRSRVKIFLSLF